MQTNRAKSPSLLVGVLVYFAVFSFLTLSLISFRAYHAIEDLPRKVKVINDRSFFDQEIDTGDLLGVSYRNPVGLFVNVFYKTIWSHTAIAWRDPKTHELYVIEGVHYFDSPYQGIVKIPIQHWLRFNRKHTIGWLQLHSFFQCNRIHLAHCIHSQYEKIVRFGSSMDQFNWKWTRLLMTKKYSATELKYIQLKQQYPMQSKYTCHEVVILLLQMSGIFQSTHHPSSYTSKDIMNGRVPTCKKYSYLVSPLIRLLGLQQCYTNFYSAG